MPFKESERQRLNDLGWDWVRQNHEDVGPAPTEMNAAADKLLAVEIHRGLAVSKKEEARKVILKGMWNAADEY
jgi:ribosomal protein S7